MYGEWTRARESHPHQHDLSDLTGSPGPCVQHGGSTAPLHTAIPCEVFGVAQVGPCGPSDTCQDIDKKFIGHNRRSGGEAGQASFRLGFAEHINFVLTYQMN